jgi:hypothetical protein
MPAYHYSNYGDDFCLKPPLMLWVAVIFLSRAVLVPEILGIFSMAGVNSDAVAYLRPHFNPLTLLPAVLAVPVLVAMLRRAPSAATVVRWLWSHGRILLAAAAGMDLALALNDLVTWREFDSSLPPPPLLVAVFDVYFLLYVLLVRRVRDTFADFPPPVPQN